MHCIGFFVGTYLILYSLHIRILNTFRLILFDLLIPRTHQEQCDFIATTERHFPTAIARRPPLRMNDSPYNLRHWSSRA